ncbi:MAG: hypothetical protein J7J75_00685 [Euryarchaeota archaeon]|nr:hypothetical protein [Euryarchaeota archaeon]
MERPEVRNVSLWLDDTFWDFESFPRLKERGDVPVVYTTGDVKLDKKSFELFNAPPPGYKPIKVSLRFVGGIGGIRVSMHFFNTKDSIEYLVEIQESS